MATIPTPIHTTAKMIYADYEKNADNGHRPHLGASLIGHHCERYLWLVFHWAKAQSFEGRMLRLFETGKLEEKRIARNLRAIGCEVWEDDGTGQYRVASLGGHFGGSMDAVIQGYHEAPKQTMPVEMKTHNAKSFKDLVAKHVLEAKPMHWSQMQVYMGLSGVMTNSLYFATNKDTDDIYTERVKFDKDAFDRLHARAERIIKANEPPLRISEDPSWYQCKFCSMHGLCHGTEAPEVNCRTCAHSSPNIKTGEWDCSCPTLGVGHLGTPIEIQRAGCTAHRYIPILLEKFATMVDANETDNWVRYKNTLTGNEFYNGDLSSVEIYNCQDKRSLGDPGVQDLRHELDAKIAS